jgi:hypothetical protein
LYKYHVFVEFDVPFFLEKTRDLHWQRNHSRGSHKQKNYHKTNEQTPPSTMLALKKKREAEAKAKAEEAAKDPSGGGAEEPKSGKVSLLGIGGKKQTKNGDDKKGGKKRTPGEIRIQKGKFTYSCLINFVVEDFYCVHYDSPHDPRPWNKQISQFPCLLTLTLPLYYSLLTPCYG